jgi:nucleotide-binding universal stress UspA family protein
MTIVCASRFTEESSFAVNVAADLALKHGQRLCLVHVLPRGAVPSWGDFLDAAATNALENEAKALSARGIKVEIALLHGKLEQALHAYCLEVSARLLVVGDTAKRVSPLLAGTLDRLAYQVEAPLLVVRDPRPFNAWVKGNAPLKLMLALDRTSSSAIARDWISRLAEYGDIDLVAARIWWPLEEYERRHMQLPSLEDGHAELAKVMRKETEAALGGLPKNVKHRIHLEVGERRVAEHLLALANEEQVDLVVLGTHRRRALGRLWSVSHHALALAPMSVACIPATVPVADLTRVPAFHTAIAATNFTEAGNRSVRSALGAVGDGTVHVVHVSADPFTPAHEKTMLQMLVDVLPPEAEWGGARVLVHVLHGDVVNEVLRASERLGSDVVCLGMRADVLMPSAIVPELLRRSRKPVLVTTAVQA